MKINALIAVLSFFCLNNTFAQNNLSADEVFNKVIQHYDPDGKWAQFKGTIHINTYGADWSSEENLTIDNTSNFYRSIRKDNGQVLAKGIENGQVFFEIGGKKIAASSVPESYQKAPYYLTEQNVKMSAENHIAHFSAPLMIHAAGAKPNAKVEMKEFFGVNCLVLTFEDGLPNNYEDGLFTGAITLYVDVENDYRLHALYLDNDFFGEGIGGYALLVGEMEVDGLKIPTRKIYHHGKTLQPFIIDVFDTELIEEETSIRRIFYLSYKEGTPTETIQTTKHKFQEMVGLIDGMEKAVWMKSPDADSPYQYSLLLEFANQEALHAYEEHPNHKEVIKIGQTGIIADLYMHTY